MNWTDETELFLQAVETLDRQELNDFVESADSTEASYYSSYSDGYHMKKDIIEYNISNAIELREKLDELWRNKSSSFDGIKKVAVHAYHCSKPEEKRRLAAVETHNYTI